MAWLVTIVGPFVLMMIMSTFAVPEAQRHRVLAIRLMLALFLRRGAIALGTAVIHLFGGIFYLFGVFLIYVAWKMITTVGGAADARCTENIMLRAVRAMLPVTGSYHGSHLIIRRNAKVWVTPLLIVIIAIGTTDLLFALDSIPAAFGLTTEPFLILTANSLALVGLRHLYFLLAGLVGKLAYLPHGLAVIVGALLAAVLASLKLASLKAASLKPASLKAKGLHHRLDDRVDEAEQQRDEH